MFALLIFNIFPLVLYRRMYNIHAEPGPAGEVTCSRSTQSKLPAGEEPSTSAGQVSAGQRTRDRVRSTSHFTDSRLRQTELDRLTVQ